MTDSTDEGIPVHDTTESKAAHEAVLNHLDATPNEELRELVKEWREHAGMEAAPEQWALNKCADELEERINE